MTPIVILCKFARHSPPDKLIHCEKRSAFCADAASVGNFTIFFSFLYSSGCVSVSECVCVCGSMAEGGQKKTGVGGSGVDF